MKGIPPYSSGSMNILDRKPQTHLRRLNIRMPLAEEATLLNIARSQPVVDMDRWVWSDKEILFEYTHIIANASLHEYTYTYEIDEEASK